MWILMGCLGIWDSFFSLSVYNGLYEFQASDITISKNLILGLLCLSIGITGLLKIRLIKGRRTFLIMFLSYSFIWSISSFLDFGEPDFSYIFLPDYFLLFLIEPSLKGLKEVDKSVFNHIFSIFNSISSNMLIVVKSLIYNLLILICSLIISNVMAVT